MGRRAGRTGTQGIRRTESGRYESRVMVHGTARTATLDTEAEAKLWRAKTIAAMHADRPTKRTSAHTTLDEYVGDFLTIYTADLRASTRRGYERNLRLHILPELGGLQLRNIDETAIRQWRANLIAKHAETSPSIPKLAYTHLRVVLSAAYAEGLIGRKPDPIKGATKDRAPERKIATPDQVLRLYWALPPNIRLMVPLATHGSLRLGEVLALKRRCFDFAAGTLTIEESVGYYSVEPEWGEPKTMAGRRVLHLPAEVMALAKEHCASFVAPKGDSLVFLNSLGGHLKPTGFQYQWERARDQVPDLPVVPGKGSRKRGFHFHDLRHTGLTWAADAGASTASLMRRGGHTTPEMALRYQHATARTDAALAASLPVVGFAPPTDDNVVDIGKRRRGRTG